LKACIALIDWNWLGHHPTYFTHFAEAMAEAGCRVVALCPDPDDFRRRIAQSRLPSELADRIGREAGKLTARQSDFRPARWRGYHQSWLVFGDVGRRLRRWEREQGAKIDLVFFACIYDRQFERFGVGEKFLRYPWAGLYLHARSFRMPGSPLPIQGGLPCPEQMLRRKSLKALGILDEGIVDAVSEFTGGKPVVVFPDITETAMPAQPEEGLVRKIKMLAAGRPIVSLTGHLLWTKGMDVFTKVAAHPAMGDVFFFLGGSVLWHQIPDEERRLLEGSWERTPNLYAHLQSLPEPTMNAVLSASDVVFAAYRQFPNSSNMLTKVATVERPVLVSDGYLMAERVRRFDMGEVVPEGDVEATVDAIRKMLAPGYLESLRQRARWSEYREAHSVGRLRQAIGEILKSL
jgi:glycosyltransferase involved in cell wall biosynthesis